MLARYALFVAAGGFALGALMRSTVAYGVAAVCFMLVLASLFFLASSFLRTYLFIGIALVFVSFGSLRVMLAPLELPDEFHALVHAEASLDGRVVLDPDVRETGQRVTIEIEREGESTRVLAVLPSHPEIAYGEHVRVSGVIELPEPFSTDGGREFRYDRYLAKDGVFLIMPRARVEIREEASGAHAAFFGTLYAARRAFVSGLEAALPEPESGLATGILVGGKQGLGKELLDAFTVAGLVHVVVLSGYNVMIVANALMRSFAFLPARMAASVGVAAIGLFVLAAGAGSASVRAGLMAGAAVFARATERTYDALRGLALVLLLMLMHNPLLIAYDVGFQFSFMATVGLIVGTPIVSAWLGWMRNGFLREIAATTIAAQLGVLPILLYHTGNLSLVALPANLLVLPLLPLAMLLSFVAGIVGMLVPFLAPVVGAPAYLILALVVGMAETAAALPFASVTIPSFGIGFVAIAYLLLAWYAYRATPSPLQSAPQPSSN